MVLTEFFLVVRYHLATQRAVHILGKYFSQLFRPGFENHWREIRHMWMRTLFGHSLLISILNFKAWRNGRLAIEQLGSTENPGVRVKITLTFL